MKSLCSYVCLEYFQLCVQFLQVLQHWHTDVQLPHVN